MPALALGRVSLAVALLPAGVAAAPGPVRVALPPDDFDLGEPESVQFSLDEATVVRGGEIPL